MQTQSSTHTDGTALSRKVKRLMPTVGCEADAVAFKEEERVTTLDPHSSAGDTPAFRRDGSWSLPAELEGGVEKFAPVCFPLLFCYPSIGSACEICLKLIRGGALTLDLDVTGWQFLLL